jgi:hypothetical protein
MKQAAIFALQVANKRNGNDVDKFGHLLHRGKVTGNRLLLVTATAVPHCLHVLQVANKRNGIDVDKFDYLRHKALLRHYSVTSSNGQLLCHIACRWPTSATASTWTSWTTCCVEALLRHYSVTSSNGQLLCQVDCT